MKGIAPGIVNHYAVIFDGWQEIYIFPVYTVNAKVWHGANGPYGVLGQQVPIMRILDD